MNPESLQTATLTSLAMLKVHADAKERQDYVDYLKPFAIHVLVEHKPFPVSREQLQYLVLQEFGLKVPVRGCELILKRFAKSGHLDKSHGTYSLKKDLPASDIQAKKVDAMRRGNFVVSLFAIECLATYANGTALPGIKDRNSKDIHLVAAFIKAAENKNHDFYLSPN